MNENGLEIEEQKESGKTNDATGDAKRETTRSKIALIYVGSFLAIIALCLIGGTCVGYTVDNHKDILLTVSGVLSGPLGFIVGYYFKASKE